MRRRRSRPWPCGGGTSRDLRGQPPHGLQLQPAGLDLASSPAPDAARRGASRPAATPRSRSRPAPTVRAPGVDYFGNPTTFVTIQQNHRRAGAARAEQHRGRRSAGPDAAATPPWEAVRDLARHDRSAEALAGARVHLRLALRAARLRAAGLRRRARSRRAARCSRPRASSPTASSRTSPTSRADDARHRGAPSVRHAARRLPGLRPYPDRLPARAGPAGALRQRLPADPPARGQGAPGRRRRLARLAVGLDPRPRLGRPRPDQRRDPGPRAHHRSAGAATMATSARSAASCSAAASTRWPWRWTCSPPAEPDQRVAPGMGLRSTGSA